LPDPLGLFRLDGQIAIVTGASSGLGVRFAEVLHAAGASVVVAARRLDRLEALVERMPGSVAVACDVAVDADLETLVAITLERFGRIDVLVNNAGVAIAGPSETYSDADWDTSIGIMQTGVFLCSQAVGRHMLERRSGVIVNISSINAWDAFPMRLAYCAAKAAVVAMTEVLAIEWAGRGVRVNAVAPGVTRTALVQKGIDEGVIDVERYHNRTPMHRFGEPDEIARAVAYLADDEDSSFVTGTTLRVDGGWSAQGWIV
jgi:NAD(P)-dependent dehydrogenase (short-subunit alcohol dehydrogenase family)